MIGDNEITDNGITMKSYHYTLRALQIMIIAILFLILNVLFSAIDRSMLAISHDFYIGYDVRFSRALSDLFLLVHSIFLIFSVIFFYKGRFELNEEHGKNIKTVIILMTSFILLFLVDLLINFLIPSLPGAFLVSLSSILSILYGFIIGFTILLLIKEYATKFEKELIYILSAFLIVFPIVQNLIKLLVVNVDNLSGYFIYSSISQYIYLSFWMLAIYSYFKIYNNLKRNQWNLKIDSIGLINRDKWYAKFGKTFFAKPIIAFFIIIIIGFSFGAVEGIMYNMTVHSEEHWEDTELYFNIVSKTSILQGSGELQEYESIQVDIPINGSMHYFYVRLTWEDEPNEEYLYNQPDCYTIVVDFGGRTETVTGENPVEEPGLISIQLNLRDNETLEVDTALMTISLDYCGDHTGYWGHLPKPIAREDDSNYYYYLVEFSIYNKEEIK